MGPDDAIDALSSDFTCSSPTEKQAKEEVLFLALLRKPLLESVLDVKIVF